jgi:hypothetical protein
VESIYCDQNFLIEVRDAHEGYLAALRGLVAEAQAQFVLSLWTLVEVSRIGSPERMLELAAVIDQLGPRWLPERSILHKHEIARAFFESLQIPYDRPKTLRSLEEVAAEAGDTVVPLGKRFSALEFVALFRSQGSVFDNMIAKNQREWNSNPGPRKPKSIDRYLQPAVRAYIEDLLPVATPAGLELTPAVRARFLQNLPFDRLPSILVESELLKQSRIAGLKRSESSFMDYQHGITALPYTSILVSDDRQFASLLSRCRSRFAFPIARVLSKAEFDREFLP